MEDLEIGDRVRIESISSNVNAWTSQGSNQIDVGEYGIIQDTSEFGGKDKYYLVICIKSEMPYWLRSCEIKKIPRHIVEWEEKLG